MNSCCCISVVVSVVECCSFAVVDVVIRSEVMTSVQCCRSSNVTAVVVIKLAAAVTGVTVIPGLVQCGHGQLCGATLT